MKTLGELFKIIDGVLKGDHRSVARAITLIENKDEKTMRIMASLYPYTGKAYIIGVTGPTGSGKSTLIEKLVKKMRENEKTVGVIAVDPTSPFTGGAFLGDRIRMQELCLDQGVFIRSMASRNSLGGLSKATKDAVHVLDASGKQYVIVETVGAGQLETDIMKVAHTVVVVLAPNFGDEIQAIKAGLMEVGDIFVINKADQSNADRAFIDLYSALKLNIEKGWKPPVIKTSALTGEGVNELIKAIESHRELLKADEGKKRMLAEAEFIEAINQEIMKSIVRKLKAEKEYNELVKRIMSREVDPYTAAENLLKEKLKL